MSTQQREKFMDNVYKAGFFLLMGLCTFFIKDMHSDFKAFVRVIEDVRIEQATQGNELKNLKESIQHIKR